MLVCDVGLLLPGQHHPPAFVRRNQQPMCKQEAQSSFKANLSPLNYYSHGFRTTQKCNMLCQNSGMTNTLRRRSYADDIVFSLLLYPFLGWTVQRPDASPSNSLNSGERFLMLPHDTRTKDPEGENRQSKETSTVCCDNLLVFLGSFARSGQSRPRAPRPPASNTGPNRVCNDVQK